MDKLASQQHDALVAGLVQHFKNQGLAILCAAIPGYVACAAEGRHEPDVKAWNPSTGLVYIGEAKTHEDLSSTLSQEQILDFSRRVMASGKSEGQTVPFYLIVPADSVGDAYKVLRELGLEGRPNIFVMKS